MAEPQPPKFEEKLTDALLKLLVTGSGASSLFFLYRNDFPKAVIALCVTAGGTLLTSFGEGLLEPLKTNWKERGKKLGAALDKEADKAINQFTDKLSDFEQKYREAVKAHCYRVEMEGFQDLPPLALADVFVPLRIESEDQRHINREVKQIWDFLPPINQITPHFPYRRIVVLAQPGYGKTTLLRHLAFVYVTEPPKDTPAFLPVLLRLRDIYQLIAIPTQEPDTRGQFRKLSEVIIEHFKNQPEFKSLEVESRWFEDHLKAGKCLIMLDGLDEVPKGQRDLIRQWVDSQMKQYKQTQFILTSRIHGFEINPDEPSHTIERDCKLSILDFNGQQIEDFINNWYVHFFWLSIWEPLFRDSQNKPESLRLTEENTKRKSDQDAQDSANHLIRQIFANPSLSELAKNPLQITMITATHRVNTELPKKRVELYDKISNLLLGTRPYAKKITPTLTASQNEAILQVLAWNLVKRDTTQFTPKDGEEWIKKTLKDCCKEHSLTSKSFWKEMIEITGFLQERELGKYEFTHRTFQEYFAALQFKEMGEQGEKAIIEKLKNNQWPEVVCFYAALGNATPLIQEAIKIGQPEALKLAHRLKEEGRQVDPSVIEQLDQILLQAKLDDLTLTATIRLEQRFKNLLSIDEKTAISDYITWGEYGLFLDAQTSGQFHSQAEVKTIPPDAENQPITSISWQDARWFCGWLATQNGLQSEGVVYDYRLPSIEQLQSFTNLPLKPWTDSPSSAGDALRVVRVEIPNRYQNLLTYLSKGRWRDADEETFKVMLDVAGRTDKGYLDYDSIQNFPCEDLRIIDQLWVKYSNGHFGFSVQKNIWLEVGGQVDYETEDKLGDRGGWRKQGKWRFYDFGIFDLSSARLAHLPSYVWWRLYLGGDAMVGGVGGRGWSLLAQRLVTCNI